MTESQRKIGSSSSDTPHNGLGLRVSWVPKVGGGIYGTNVRMETFLRRGLEELRFRETGGCMPDHFQNVLLRELPSLVLEKLKPRLRAQNFAPGQVLFTAGDKITNMYFLRAGAVSLVCELAG